MKLTTSSARRQAFTLIELMAAIAIILLLFTLVSPQIGKAMLRGKLTKEAANARYIVEAIAAKDAASRFSNGWPQSAEGADNYENSTEFFKDLVNEGYLDVDFSFFAAPGMTPARDESDFTEANNAWCVLVNVNDTTPGNTPVVWLKNVNASDGTFLEGSVPFGNKGFAFSTKNGEAVVVSAAEIANGDSVDIFKFPDEVVVDILEP
jgi:prepilin-type N-terminal cleavage/methylation domain-containing protein